MAETRTVVINVISNTGGATKGIGNLQRQMGGLNKGTAKATKSVGGLNKTALSAKRGLGSFAGGMGSAGLAAGAAGAGILAVGSVIKGSVSAFAGFDDKMNQSIAIMGNVSDAMRDRMSNAAREMAKTTRFSAEDAAESYFFLASAGLNAEQSIAALPAVAKFAQAGMFDMALATDLATDAQSALGLKSEDSAENLKNMTRVTDVFVKANTLANTSVQQVSEAITNKLGGALRSYNIEIEEGVAVLAAYADQGLKGASAGEAMNIMLRDLKKVGAESADVLAANNIQIFDSQGNFRNMADIIDDLSNAFVGLSVEQQTQLAADIGFQDRSFKNIQLLFGMGSAVRSYEADLKKAGGTTAEVAGKQMQSFSAQMDVLKSNVIDAGISLGEQLAPTILEIGKGLVEFIGLVTPLIVGLVKLQKILFKFTPLGVMFKGLGEAMKGFALLSELWDPAAKAANRYKTAQESIGKAVEAGAQPAAAYANALVFMADQGELTAEALVTLAEGLDFQGEEAAVAKKEVLDWSKANGVAADQIDILEAALLADVIASDRDAASKRELAFELGLVSRGASDLELMELGLIDSTVALTDAEGNLIDETADTTGEVLTLADALAEAEAAQTSLADAMLAFADPTFAAVDAISSLQDAQAKLSDLQDDGKASSEELAQAQLDVAKAVLTAQGKLDAFSAGNIDAQISVIAAALDISDEAARELLATLGIIDGTEVTAGATVVFKASGSSTARKAVSGGAAAQFFGPGARGLADGGPATAGRPYLVGEEGPELFVPRGSGTVIPAGQTSQIINSGGNSRSMNVTFVNSQLANDPSQAIRRAFARDAVASKV